MVNLERIENSLTSGLPNEIDFVFNTLLLLSNDDSFSFRVNGTNTRLINLILANIGFFGDGILFEILFCMKSFNLFFICL